MRERLILKDNKEGDMGGLSRDLIARSPVKEFLLNLSPLPLLLPVLRFKRDEKLFQGRFKNVLGEFSQPFLLYQYN